MVRYDETILRHYKDVAESSGISGSSTMADARIRHLESDSILTFVRAALSEQTTDALVVFDVGCGNGHTLNLLRECISGPRYYGFEFTPELRRLAEKRFEGLEARPEILAADIRDPEFFRGRLADVLICQRVLINLLDQADQKRALANLISSVKPGGLLLFIEAFQSGLERLNEARAEFGLPALPPAHHNLYLDDNFFEDLRLVPLGPPSFNIPQNQLSTHYYLSRVLHAAATDGQAVKRNSHFVSFLSAALPTAIGDYSPLQICAFRKVRES